MSAPTPDEAAAQMVARLTMNEPLLPWPELSQDMAFIAVQLDALRAREAAVRPVLDAADAWVDVMRHAALSSDDLTLTAAVDTFRSALGGSSEAGNTEGTNVKVKSMTLRLPQEQADELELIASVDGKHMSEEIREALEQHIKSRREDPEFQARLERNRDRLSQLAALAGAAAPQPPEVTP